jgi:GGDEF domain-containing protein
VPQLRPIKLLLVEDDLGDETLLREALGEIEEIDVWRNWGTPELTHAERLSDALEILALEQFDAILLNLSLPDSPALLDAFLETKTAAGETPILILADSEDEELGAALIREGAQDVIFKGAIECAPLARALRYAIGRSKEHSARVAAAYRDHLTGLYNRGGFLEIAGHYLQLARAARRPCQLVLLELGDPKSIVREERDLLMIRAGYVARGMFDEPTVAGRVGARTLALLAFGATSQTAKRKMNEFRLEIRSEAESFPKTVRARAIEADPEQDQSAADLLEEAERQLELPARVPAGKTAMLAD